MVKSLEEFENGCIAMLCTVVRSVGDLRPYTLATGNKVERTFLFRRQKLPTFDKVDQVELCRQ